MSAFKINLALIRDCPSLLTLKAALETLGRPSDRDYGVMGVGDVIEGKLPFEFFKTKEQKVPQVDKLDGSLRQPTIRKDDIFKCAVRMASNVTPAQVGTIAVLEVYSGSSASIEKVKELFSVLELADQIPQIEPITLDIMSKLSDVRDGAKLFQLVSAKVKGYKDSADEQIAGTYTVKFPKSLETSNAVSFCQEHADELDGVKVKVKREDLSKPITITLRTVAFFTLSAPDSDETRALNICRALAGTLVPRVRHEEIPAAADSAV
jgi:hypothetical protein